MVTSKQNLRAKIRGSSEFRAYMDALWARLPGFTERAAAVPPGAPGSVEWLGRVGKFWWTAREQARLSRYEVAGRMGVDVNDVRLFEFGLEEQSGGVTQDFAQRYAEALNRPDLYVAFRSEFYPKSVNGTP